MRSFQVSCILRDSQLVDLKGPVMLTKEPEKIIKRLELECSARLRARSIALISAEKIQAVFSFFLHKQHPSWAPCEYQMEE